MARAVGRRQPGQTSDLLTPRSHTISASPARGILDAVGEWARDTRSAAVRRADSEQSVVVLDYRRSALYLADGADVPYEPPRARAVREAVDEYTERHTEFERLEGLAVAALAFDYEQTPVIRALHTVQHEFEEIISATQHMHNREWWLETLFCHGFPARMRELVYRLRAFDAVGRLTVMFLQPERSKNATE